VLYAGDDWAEDHHDVALVDQAGRRLARARLNEGMAGIARFHELIADHLPEGDGPGQVVIGIETGRGPWVTALVASGYQVYAVNPLSVARYRERHSVSGAKSDAGMRGCWLTWCAPTLRGTARWPGTARPRRGSRYWRGRTSG
jgi:transposase